MLGVVLYRGMAGQFSATPSRCGRGGVAVLALRRRRLDPAVLAPLPVAREVGGPDAPPPSPAQRGALGLIFVVIAILFLVRSRRLGGWHVDYAGVPRCSSALGVAMAIMAYVLIAGIARTTDLTAVHDVRPRSLEPGTPGADGAVRHPGLGRRSSRSCRSRSSSSSSPSCCWVFLRLWHAPPARRGKTRIEPATPDGIHMPGPSFAPDPRVGRRLHCCSWASSSAALLVVGGDRAWRSRCCTGWPRRCASTTTRSGRPAPPLPAVVHDGPPPGVHMPGPSFRPFLGAVGVTMLMLGLVFGEWLLLAGVIALVVTLVGWLVDARQGVRKTVEADQTGHLENIPAPRTPTLLLVGARRAAHRRCGHPGRLGAATRRATAEAARARPGASGGPAHRPGPRLRRPRRAGPTGGHRPDRH